MMMIPSEIGQSSPFFSYPLGSDGVSNEIAPPSKMMKPIAYLIPAEEMLGI